MAAKLTAQRCNAITDGGAVGMGSSHLGKAEPLRGNDSVWELPMSQMTQHASDGSSLRELTEGSEILIKPGGDMREHSHNHPGPPAD